MTRATVLHLVDDTTAGGVMRVLEFLKSSATLNAAADHQVKSIKRGAIPTKRLKADIIVSHLAISWGTLPSLLALRLMHPGTPLVHVEHSYTEAFVRHCVKRTRRFHLLLRTGFRIFDRIVAVSNGQAAWFQTAGLVQKDRVHTIQSCVDLKAFRQLRRRASSRMVFGAIGRFEDQKGFDILVDAFRRLPNRNVELRLYGQGSEEDRLRALAGDDDRIRFMGHVADPTAALSDLDVVLMPSRWEAYGLVGVEALSAGRKLIANRIDGMQDHAAGGALFSKGSSAEDWLTTLRDFLACPSAIEGVADYRTSNRLERRFELGWLNLVEDLLPDPFRSNELRGELGSTAG